MLKKLVSFAMIFSFLTVHASAATNNGLKAAYDELNYSLNVDWDQKDKAFYQSSMKKFTDAVSLMQTEGLSNAEIIGFVKNEIKDEAAARDLETAFNVISINKMAPSEATQYMLNTMKKTYARGSSWLGFTTGELAITAAIVVGLALLVIFAPAGSSEGIAAPANPGYCTQIYQCNNFCYNDALFGYTCQPNCFWTCY
jgi:hypothetical protein